MYQPDYPAALGLLTHLSADELQAILDDESKFDAIVKDVQQVKDWEAEKEFLIASNRSLAEYNLSRKPELMEAKQKIARRSERGEELCKSVQEKMEEYKSKSGNASLDTTLALLETAAAQSEEESEEIAQKFLSGEYDIEKFLDEFSKTRKQMHMRKIKVDKMNELINKMQHGGQPSLFGNSQNTPYPPAHGYFSPPNNAPYPPNSSPYPPNSAPYPSSNSVPYPTGPLNMPMPGLYRNHF